MKEPITTLDPQNSAPNAVATPWEETRRVLESTEMFWLTTVRADGRPHATPVVAVWLDGAIHFTALDTAQKGRNLRGNRHVLLTTNCTWNSGLAVVVEGDAVQVTDDEVLERLAQAWATRWNGGVWLYQVQNGSFQLPSAPRPPERIPVFSVTHPRVLAWISPGASDLFSLTRYQF